MKKNCELCNVTFDAVPFYVRKGYGRFCSRKCFCKYKLKNRIKILCKICKKEFLVIPSKAKARYCSQKCYRIGQRQDIDGGLIRIVGKVGNKSTLGRTDEKANRWKGNEVGYDALHSWVKRKLGRPDTCEHCGRSNLGGHMIHWANKSQEYKRNLEDWLRLCASCHKQYDHVGVR